MMKIEEVWKMVQGIEREIVPGLVLEHVRDDLRSELGLKRGEIKLVHEYLGSKTGVITVKNTLGNEWYKRAREIVAESYDREGYVVKDLAGALEVSLSEREVYWCIFAQGSAEAEVTIVRSQPIPSGEGGKLVMAR